MTDTENLCVTGCNRPADAYLCNGCVGRLRNTLKDLPGMIAEITVTASKQSATQRSEGGQSKKSEYAMPLNWAASDMAWVAENTLTTWARHIYGEMYPDFGMIEGPEHGPCFHESCNLIRTWPLMQVPSNVAALCGWIAGRLWWVAGRPEADQFFDEITGLMADSSRAVDTTADRYAGPCTMMVRSVLIDHVDDNGTITLSEQEFRCDGALRTHPGQKVIRCPKCGAEHDPTQRMAWIMEKTRSELALGPTIASLLSDALGRRVTWASIRKMEFSGHIVHVTTDDAGRKLYRVGDVLDVVQAREVANNKYRMSA